jgi:hypothetical protein
MTRKAARALTAAVLATALASGCAAMKREDEEAQGRLLAAAGFQIRPVDTAARKADLQGVPADKLLSHPKGDTMAYTFYDPDVCECLYIGGPAELGRFSVVNLLELQAGVRGVLAEESVGFRAASRTSRGRS